MTDCGSAVEHLKKYIEKNREKEHRVMKALNALDKIDISLDILQITGIGKCVNELKKRNDLSQDAVEKSKALVCKWKGLVQSSVKNEHRRKLASAPDEDCRGERECVTSADSIRNKKSAVSLKEPRHWHDAITAPAVVKATSSVASVTVQDRRSKGSDDASTLRGDRRESQMSQEEGSRRKGSRHEAEAEGHGRKGSRHEAEAEDRGRKGSRHEAEAEACSRKLPVADESLVQMETNGDCTSSALSDREKKQTSKRLDFTSKLHDLSTHLDSKADPTAAAGSKKRPHSEQPDGHSASSKRPRSDDHDGRKADGARDSRHAVASGEGKHARETSSKQRSTGDSTSAKPRQLGAVDSDDSQRKEKKRKRSSNSSDFSRNEGSSPAEQESDSCDQTEGHRGQSFEDVLAYDRDAADCLARKKRKLAASVSASHRAKAGSQSESSSGRPGLAVEGSSSKSYKDLSEAAKVFSSQSPLGSKHSKESSKNGSSSKPSAMSGKAASSFTASPSTATGARSASTILQPGTSSAENIVVPLPPRSRLAISAADIMNGLPEISSEYRPARTNGREGGVAVEPFELGAKHYSHTQVYSGRKQHNAEMLPLFDLCLRVLMNNIGSIGYVGHVPCSILMPVLKKCTVQQLQDLEYYNPVFVAETGELWKKHCQRDFAGSEPREYESWRELYMALREEQAKKVEEIAARVAAMNKLKAPERKTKLAYMDTVAKPPREVRRMQQRLGISPSSGRAPAAAAAASAAAAGPSRVSSSSQKDASQKETSPRNATYRAPVQSTPPPRPKAVPPKSVAPLMKQAMKFAKGVRR